MVQALEKRFGLAAQDIVLFGESLGGSVALQAAADMESGVKEPPRRHPLEVWRETGKEATSLAERMRRTLQLQFAPADPAGERAYRRPGRTPGAVVCFASIASVARRVKEAYPRLPVEAMRNPFAAEKAIGRITAPTLILHGTEDDMTGTHHAEILKRNGGPNVEMELIPGANHCLTFPDRSAVDPAKVKRMVDRVHAFLAERRLCPPEAGPALAPDRHDENKFRNRVHFRPNKDGRQAG
jgi:pimeloyl-ACP methyl ester carboxylesterase